MIVPSPCQYREVPFEKTKKRMTSAPFSKAKRADITAHRELLKDEKD